jgi:hypothetical protein
MTRTIKNAAVLALIGTLIFSIAGIAATSVSYFTGRVSFFDGKKVVADGMEFTVIERCAYLKHSKRNNAYFEDKAGSGEVRGGDSVILHINGNVVDKIIIEEWKR